MESARPARASSLASSTRASPGPPELLGQAERRRPGVRPRAAGLAQGRSLPAGRRRSRTPTATRSSSARSSSTPVSAPTGSRRGTSCRRATGTVTAATPPRRPAATTASRQPVTPPVREDQRDGAACAHRRVQGLLGRGSGDGGCNNSDSVAAIDKAVSDGVDVINFSISGTTDELPRRGRGRVPVRSRGRRVRCDLGRQRRPGQLHGCSPEPMALVGRGRHAQPPRHGDDHARRDRRTFTGPR